MQAGLIISLVLIALISGIIIGAVAMEISNLDTLTGYFAMERCYNSVASKEKATEILINNRDLYKKYIKFIENRWE